MKKSTKIILIASGTVIFISVILIIVLALTMKAQTPSPELPSPSPTGYECLPSSFTERDSGVQLSFNVAKEEVDDGKWKITLSWSYNGDIDWLRKQYLGESGWLFPANIQNVIVMKNSQETPVELTDRQNPFASGEFVDYITPQEGEIYSYRIKQTICWKGVVEGLIQRRDDYIDYIMPPGETINFDDLDNPTSSPTIGGGTPSSSSGDICECTAPRLGIIQTAATLQFINCSIRCEFFKFSVLVFNWSFNVMRYYTGLDGLQEIPETEMPTS